MIRIKQDLGAAHGCLYAILLPLLKRQLCLMGNPTFPAPVPTCHWPPSRHSASGNALHRLVLVGHSADVKHCMKILLFIAGVTDNGKSKGQPCPAQTAYLDFCRANTASTEGPGCDAVRWPAAAEVCGLRGPSSTWTSYPTTC